MDNNQFENQATVNEAANEAATFPPVVEEAKPGFDVLGLIAMICGILSITLGCCYFIGWVPAAAAIVLSLISKAKRGRFSPFALVGLICGGVGALIFIGYVLYLIVYYVFLFSAYGDFYF